MRSYLIYQILKSKYLLSLKLQDVRSVSERGEPRGEPRVSPLVIYVDLGAGVEFRLERGGTWWVSLDTREVKAGPLSSEHGTLPPP